MMETGPEIQPKKLAEVRPLGEPWFRNVALHKPYFGFDKSENLQGEKMDLFP